MRGISLSGRRGVVVGITTLGLVAGGATWVVAAGSDATHPRSQAAADPRIAGQSTGGGCRMGYDTQTSTNIPPDDSTADNVPANSVTIRKVCPGAVIASWTGEVSTPGASDFIHMDIRATCTGTGGLANPCTVGQQVFASPGHTFVKNGADTFSTHSVTMAFSGLQRGIWRIDALPGGNNSANVQFRTLVVEAFNGG